MVSIFQKFKISNLGAILSIIVSLVTIIGFGISIINFVILNNLSPVLSHLEKLDMKVQAVETTNSDDVSQTQLKESYDRLNLRIDDLITRVNSVANRVGAIQDALIRR